MEVGRACSQTVQSWDLELSQIGALAGDQSHAWIGGLKLIVVDSVYGCGVAVEGNGAHWTQE